MAIISDSKFNLIPLFTKGHPQACIFEALRLFTYCHLSDPLFPNRPFPDLKQLLRHIVGVSVGPGTLHLYELVREPYISMNV